MGLNQLSSHLTGKYFVQKIIWEAIMIKIFRKSKNGTADDVGMFADKENENLNVYSSGDRYMIFP